MYYKRWMLQSRLEKQAFQEYDDQLFKKVGELQSRLEKQAFQGMKKSIFSIKDVESCNPVAIPPRKAGISRKRSIQDIGFWGIKLQSRLEKQAFQGKGRFKISASEELSCNPA